MKACSCFFNKIKKAIAIKIVAGNPEPMPSGAMANPKMIPPRQANFTQILFSINPSAIRNWPTAMLKTITVMCCEKKPLINLLYKGSAFSVA